MQNFSDNNSAFALTAYACGEPSKLYTPILILNLDKVIAAEVHAMWDTGSEVCIISRKLAELLQFDMAPGPVARGLTGASETAVCYAYVSFVAGGGIITVKCAVVDGYVGGVDYSVILGLSLIRRGTLAITGGENGITLSFKMPATNLIDLTTNAGDIPVSTESLSCGPESINVISGVEAVKLMAKAIPGTLK